jgi:hypothetical protein
VTTVFVTSDLDDDRNAWIALDAHLRLCAWRTTWPVLARLNTRLLVRWRTREVDLIRRAAVQGLVRAVLVVPGDGEIHFPLEFGLVFKTGIVIKRRISFNVLWNRSTTAMLPRFPTAPNLGRMFLALHHTFSKCSHLNSRP